MRADSSLDCMDAVGISTPWGDSCEEVKPHCFDPELRGDLLEICPATCGSCGGAGSGAPTTQGGAQAGAAPPPAPAAAPAGGSPNPAGSTPPDSWVAAAGGCEDRDEASCKQLEDYCENEDISDDVQEACPATCRRCTSPMTSQQAPAMTSTTSCAGDDCKMKPPDVPAEGTPRASGGTPSGAPPVGGECKDRDEHTCAQILGYCFHEGLGTQVQNSCPKSCGLCDGSEGGGSPAAGGSTQATSSRPPSTTSPTPSPPAPTPSPTAATPAPTAATPVPTALTPAPTGLTPAPTEVTPAPTEGTPAPTLAPTLAPTSEPTTTEAVVEEIAEPAPAPVEDDTDEDALSEECTLPGDDCRQSKCCADVGMQCYEKNSKFATCHAECNPDEPDEEGELWTCKKLGHRAPPSSPDDDFDFTTCPVAGDDCSDSLCCSEPGMQCYGKNEYFASCKKTCEKGERDTPTDDPWSCKELGIRTPWPPEMQLCQWPGDNCIISKCCKMPETTCYKQDEYFAACKQYLDAEGEDADWDGLELGGFNTSIDVPMPPAAGAEAAGTSLFCFAVVTPGYVAEEELVSQQEAAGLGVFACDASMRLEGSQVGKGEWQSVQNTAVFADIWHQVHDEGTYQGYDWTVKVDPDAVFFPERLKGKLEALSAPKDFPLYIKNCGFKFGFMGSLEIFSRAAIEAYADNQGDCLVNIGTDGGEDFYMKTCMDAIGVGHMEDTSLLRDRYDFVAFPGDFSPSGLDDCSDGGAVAYHPHKTWEKWLECKSLSEGAAGDFGGGGGGGDGGVVGGGAEDVRL